MLGIGSVWTLEGMHEIAKVTLKDLSSCKDKQLGPLEMPEEGLVGTCESSGQANTDLPSELAFNMLLKFPLIFLPTERSTGAEHPKPIHCLCIASVSSSRDDRQAAR